MKTTNITETDPSQKTVSIGISGRRLSHFPLTSITAYAIRSIAMFNELTLPPIRFALSLGLHWNKKSTTSIATTIHVRFQIRRSLKKLSRSGLPSYC